MARHDAFAPLKQSPGLHVARVGVSGAWRGAVIGGAIVLGLALLASIGLPLFFSTSVLVGDITVGVLASAIAGLTVIGGTIGALAGSGLGTKAALNEHDDIRNGRLDTSTNPHLRHLEKGLQRKDERRRKILEERELAAEAEKYPIGAEPTRSELEKNLDIGWEEEERDRSPPRQRREPEWGQDGRYSRRDDRWRGQEERRSSRRDYYADYPERY